jgi:hypothetical protein
MDPLDPETHSEVDASALCRECGLCCDWSLFRSAALQRHEVAWADSRHLPLLQRGDEVSIAFPCAMLEAKGSERVCADYERRPTTCRNFECKVLAGYKRGELSEREAFGLVRKARTLVARVEESITGARLYQSFSAKLEAMADGVGPFGPQTVRATDPGTLLDLGALRSVVQAFHDHRSQRAHVEVEAELHTRATDWTEWDRLFRSIGGDELAQAPSVKPLMRETATRELVADGFTCLGQILSLEEAKALASMTSGLVAAGWPAAFLFMHARVWEIPQRLDPWLRATLGEEYEPARAVWAWHVASDKANSAWPPTREYSTPTVGANGDPQSITVWISLTDATPGNGCIYVLPPALDPFYGSPAGRVAVLDVQNVRALPAMAGEGLAWNHQVVHWAGRARSAHPGVSIGFEFRRSRPASAAKATKPVEKSRVPSVHERLACIANQILRYDRFGGIENRFVSLAATLARPEGETTRAPPDVR